MAKRFKREDKVRPRHAPYSKYDGWTVKWVYSDGTLLITRSGRWFTMVDPSDLYEL